ncbi:putative 2,1-fructan:2,1-fructan 1-fructosyltransferase [Helianthus annuus]|nr:putative 2,1-fructan:2,1-fructan 1-fructosyltransferase [Helianthus annuus]
MNPYWTTTTTTTNHHKTFVHQGCVGVTFVVFFFAFAIVFIVLNQQNSSVHIDTNSDKSFIRYSKADRLSWERTAFHFQPAKNFIYDPNGPLFHMGWYHLFYQYNPYAPVWGNMSWGHSVSKDMINWYELPVAMVPTEWYDIEGVLSGSTTVLPNGQIFALYTGNANDFSQLQCKAVPVNLSDPLLIEWVKYDDNQSCTLHQGWVNGLPGPVNSLDRSDGKHG